jgi:hypothetical protein
MPEMIVKNIFVVLLSVLLSVSASLWLTSSRKKEFAKVVQTGTIELVDDQHRVRGTIGLVKTDGQEVPQILLRDGHGNIAVLLSINERGEGTLYFNSKDKEGKVGLGYLWGSDTPPASGEDPLGAWGLRVLGRDGRAVGFGIGTTDIPFGPAR